MPIFIPGPDRNRLKLANGETGHVPVPVCFAHAASIHDPASLSGRMLHKTIDIM
ncbi:hypothetical protein [Komagataeibacter saccharivorans]|uniref:hypothetical protein n=1 Tax=Komagataeibacter saccharivorans TaxID=265959 RepID=UPI0013C2F743|nr:hypothetical protein [Komagataeibacter saccharivorans]